MTMTAPFRSGCPINLSLEVFGDRWTLIVLRDMMFGNRRHFRDLLVKSDEGISSSILADRLKMLVEAGMITNIDDPGHKQRTIYSLTEKAIALVPVFVHLGAWGRRYLPVTEPFSIRAKLLEEGGPDLAERFMAELKVLHVSNPLGNQTSQVLTDLTAAFRATQKANGAVAS
jgi:DNA-binding HxlR family transcriptional regulator